MIDLVLTIAISALTGAACGYLFARHVWQDRLLEIEEGRQDIRRKRLEIHRERFQESTSRIHRTTESEPQEVTVLREDLEQARLEMTLLREDHKLEMQMLKEENERLSNSAGQSHVTYADVEDTEALIIDPDTREIPTDRIGESEPDINTEAPEEIDSEREANDAVIDADADAVLVPEPEEDADMLPESMGLTATTIPPVPSDIGYRFENPAVKMDEGNEYSNQSISDPANTIDKAESVTGVEESLDTHRSEAEARSTTNTEKPEAQARSTTNTEKPEAEAPSTPDTEEPEMMEEAASADVVSADPPSEDDRISGPTDIRAEEQEVPFSFHWQSDRPNRRKSPQRPESRKSDDGHQGVPVFRSLHDMLTSSGVTFPLSSFPAEEIKGMAPLSDSGSSNQEAIKAAFSVQPESTANLSLVRTIVNLDDESFNLLAELGYADLSRLANLTSSEIRRLAAVFRINPDRVEQEWKPTAAAHLNMQSAAGFR